MCQNFTNFVYQNPMYLWSGNSSLQDNSLLRIAHIDCVFELQSFFEKNDFGYGSWQKFSTFESKNMHLCKLLFTLVFFYHFLNSHNGLLKRRLCFFDWNLFHYNKDFQITNNILKTYEHHMFITCSRLKHC
jgi:hypothetical protein